LPADRYNIKDYFQHWLDMGEKTGDKMPQVFQVNWFGLNRCGAYGSRGVVWRGLAWLDAAC